MTWTLTVRPEASRDLGDAFDWYESRRAGLGLSFLADAATTFQRIEELPTSFPLYYREARRAMMRRFPYKVFFILDGESVIVIRVLHASQDHRRAIE